MLNEELEKEKIAFYTNKEDKKLVAKYNDQTYEPSEMGRFSSRISKCGPEIIIGYHGFDLPEKHCSPEGINHIYLYLKGKDRSATGFTSKPKDIRKPDETTIVKGWNGEYLELDKDLESELRTILKTF